jgi:hypothetical protein
MLLTHAESRALFYGEILLGQVACAYGVCLPLRTAMEEADHIQLRRILSALKWPTGSWRIFYAEPSGDELPAFPEETERVLCFGFRPPAGEESATEAAEDKILYLPAIAEIRLDTARKQEAFRILKPYLNS